MSIWEYANPRKFMALSGAVLPWVSAAAAIVLVGGLIWGFFFTPDDFRQGSTVKIIYLHVPAAIMATSVWFMMLVTSLIWLIRRHHVSALAAKAAAPVGMVFTLIGLYSPKGPDWTNMGRSLVRGMLNSARWISDKDMSAEAQAARRISGFADLDGIEFIARIDIGTDASGDDKNEIRSAVTPDHRDYAQVMGGAPSLGLQQPSANTAPAPQPAAAPVPGRPAWAQ